MKKKIITALLISTILVPSTTTFALTDATNSDTSLVTATEVTNDSDNVADKVSQDTNLVGDTGNTSLNEKDVVNQDTDTVKVTEDTNSTETKEDVNTNEDTKDTTSQSNAQKVALKNALVSQVGDETFVEKALAEGINARQLITIKTLADLSNKSLDEVFQLFMDNEKGIGATAKDLGLSANKVLKQINNNYTKVKNEVKKELTVSKKEKKSNKKATTTQKQLSDSKNSNITKSTSKITKASATNNIKVQKSTTNIANTNVKNK